MMKINAIVTFLPAGEGGRSNPPMSGYRPPVWLGQRRDGIDVLWDFEFTFPGLAGDLPVAFSQEIEAEMRSSSAGSRDVTVEPGTAFEVREGARVVGHGRVVEVLAE